MNRCKICGQPCGIYEICRECQKDIAEGKVTICPNCNQYYISAIGCSCAKESQTTSNEERKEPEIQTQETNISINTDSNQKSSFEDGCGKSMGCGCGILALIGIILFILLISGAIVIDDIFNF